MSKPLIHSSLEDQHTALCGKYLINPRMQLASEDKDVTCKRCLQVIEELRDDAESAERSY